jgi:hypothetical protein
MSNMMMDVNIHSFGELRVTMIQSGATIWATLHHKDKNPSGIGTVAVFLKTQAEIAAWTTLADTLADTLAAQDSKEGGKV